MLLGARQFFERRGAPTPPLPYDAEVEYLQSTGTQYIDTGVVPSNNRGFEIDFAYVGEGGTYGRVFGTQVNGYSGSTTIRRVNSNSGNVMIQNLGGSWAGASDIPFDTNRHAVAINAPQGTVSFDSNVITQSMAFSSNFSASCWLFCNNNVSTQCGIMRLYGYKCVDHSTGKNLQDMIPVRFTNELGQSEGAMYDRVSGQLFRNQGTGSFAIGPDKAEWTNPYITDGLVAMWDGEWNAGGGVHDPTAQSWVDLSNNGHNLTIPSTIAFGDDYGMASDKGGAVIRRPSSVYDAIVSAGGYTIEAVFESSGVNGAIATIGNENSIYSFSTSRASFRASDKYDGLGTNLTLQYSIVTTSVAKKSWAMTVELGEETLLYENATVNRIVSYGGIAGMQYPQFVGIGLNSSYPGSNDGAGGKYYSVRLYSRAMSATEIAANYAIDKARFNLP